MVYFRPILLVLGEFIRSDGYISGIHRRTHCLSVEMETQSLLMKFVLAVEFVFLTDT